MIEYPTNAQPSTKKINDLYKRIKDQTLVLRPAFQRKLVWSTKHKISFIDTILRGYPFPEIYIANGDTDIDALSSQEIVIDGQQRLTTIVQYIDGDIKLPTNSGISSYLELPDDKKKAFLNYPVTVRDFRDIDERIIKEIFKRINQTQYSLNMFEVEHAIYDGEFISVAKSISESDVFRNLPTFKEGDISRMRDLGFVLLVMSTLEHGGYFTYDNEVEEYIKKFNDDYVDGEINKSKTLDIIKDIGNLKLNEDSMWFRKSNFFTLIIESIKNGSVPTKQKLLAFEENIQKSKLSKDDEYFDFKKYYSYMYTGTNSRQARVERAKILVKYCF